jgi:hypothetical protein
VEILGPKGPKPHGGVELLPWARNELLIAEQIMDNPGGGLLFATQTVGQVKAALSEEDHKRWHAVVELLDRAEDLMVRRHFEAGRRLLTEARGALQELGEAPQVVREGEAAQPA